MQKTVTLLLVEDETAIRDMLHFSLSNEFRLIDVENVEKAKTQTINQPPDLILLDWMLPGESGIEFIDWIKKQVDFRDVPIIMLTAKSKEENKIRGLMTGADDYITKPFSPDELTARIKTVLRRGPLLSPFHEIKYQDIVINTAKYQITVNKKHLVLSPIEYKMFHFFMEHPNKTYTRDQLITRIWGGNVYIDDRTVDVHIRRLRDKLKKYDRHHLIKTIRGAGYQFVTNHEEQ
ncbi:response regulator [Coxiella endosymbiont of Amblyomma sculptum]|uniref:winged helix-turn-helix domain-containing protein n=1 Tax=Coxiella endosymbiont of Amblyomma sculptum TaxID=2487929 RepID=UPI00132EAD26|nr:winged helix-turn-helix domain-containing protein [Coxiella endosymbiont of Amblyomma sculptum]QHG92708.1 response regulator [Coxiella endosymbiont of Amblyomma sculptum]